MQAVSILFWGRLRHRWRSWIAIALLISLVAGVVMATAAAGRRTQSAFPTFVAASGFDAELYAYSPLPGVTKLPGVAAVTEESSPDNGQPVCACTHRLNPNYFAVFALPAKAGPAFHLVSGRSPNPSDPDEVVASFTLQQDGIRIGSVIRVPFYTRSQASAYNNATGLPPTPTGPTVALRVVGFEASVFDFPSGATPQYSVFTSAAFTRSVLPHTASGYVYFVRLHGGAADIPRFERAVSAKGELPTRKTRTLKSHQSNPRSIRKPLGGGCWRYWPRWSDWRSLVRRLPARAQPRAKTSRRLLPSGSSGVS